MNITNPVQTYEYMVTLNIRGMLCYACILAYGAMPPPPHAFILYPIMAAIFHIWIRAMLAYMFCLNALLLPLQCNRVKIVSNNVMCV